MTNYRFLTCLAVCWTSSAQTPPMSPEQIQSQLLGDMRGDAAIDLQSRPDIPHTLFTPARSASPAISIGLLRHKVPKPAFRAASRAKNLSRAGEHSKAVVELEAAIRLDPQFVSAQNALGIEYGRCGRLEDAAAAFRRVIELAPGEWAGHYNLALTMLSGGDLPRAIDSARRALQLAPGQTDVKFFLDDLLAANSEKKTPR